MTPIRCPRESDPRYYYEAPARKHTISPERMEEYYLPRGINKFKLNGRGESVVTAEEYEAYTGEAYPAE